MKIDIQYIKELLDIILQNDHPDFKINHEKIKPLWETDEKLNNLVFHMEILKDQGLIESSINANNIGFNRLSNGSFTVAITPLRLTAPGHQFASDLSKPGVFQTLASSFKEAGPKELVKVTFSLGKKALEKQLEGFVE